MFSSKTRPAAVAWIATAAGVSLMDFLLIRGRKATMSDVFGSAINKPLKKWPVLMAWSILTLHLFSVWLPPWLLKLKKLDPIKIMGDAVVLSLKDGIVDE